MKPAPRTTEVMALSERIAERLHALGKTERQASLEATGGADSLRYIRIRRAMPSADRLRRIADVLGTSVDWLLTGEASAATEVIAMQIPDKPRRRIEATLRISADSWKDLADALNQLRTDIAVEGRLSTSSVSGGYNSGWIIETSEDESITHESWAASLDTYLRTKDL